MKVRFSQNTEFEKPLSFPVTHAHIVRLVCASPGRLKGPLRFNQQIVVKGWHTVHSGNSYLRAPAGWTPMAACLAIYLAVRNRGQGGSWVAAYKNHYVLGPGVISRQHQTAAFEKFKTKYFLKGNTRYLCATCHDSAAIAHIGTLKKKKSPVYFFLSPNNFFR